MAGSTPDSISSAAMRWTSAVVAEYMNRPLSVTIPVYSASATALVIGHPILTSSWYTSWVVAAAVGSRRVMSPMSLSDLW